MAQEPYNAGMFSYNPYAAKTVVAGRLVVVLDGKLEERGLMLIHPLSRVVKKHEIHELISTDSIDAGPGKQVDRIAYLGFLEVQHGGVIVIGDPVYCGDCYIGEIAGFDDTHQPNHQNIIVKVAERRTGLEMGLRLRDPVVIGRAK